MYRLHGLTSGSTLPFTLEKAEFYNQLPQLLKTHKAILVRDVGATADDFDQHLLSCNLKKYEYIGGAAPRKIIKEDYIFTANEAPKDAIIPFHHELAQSSTPPKYLAFFCKKPPLYGGETPLVSSTLVCRYLHARYPIIEENLRKYGVRYRRIMPEEDDLGSPLGRSWKNTYQVKTHTELEEKLAVTPGVDYKWHGTDLEVITEILPAIKYNSETHNYTFYNSLIAAYKGWDDCRNNASKAIMYGNGEAIPASALEDIAQFMESNKVAWKWEQGDVIWIDNDQVMHSRNIFEGEREIYASLWAASDKILEMGSPPPPSKTALPLAFGLWKVPREKAGEVVYNAIEMGYRRFDCACDYGNEKEVGEGIRQAIADGICNRSNLHITSKLWNTYHDPIHVGLACRKTLDDLGLDYLDQYLIHFPISLEYVSFEDKYPPEWTNKDGKMVLVKQDLAKTWKAMESLKDMGLVHEIGLSNFNSALLRQICNIARHQPTVMQVELHPYLTQEKFLKQCQEYGMEVTGFSSLGAKSYFELSMADESQDLVDHPTIIGLSGKYGKTPVQMLLRWGIQRGTIPICKSCHPEHMHENFNIFDFSIEELDMSRITGLNKNLRFNDPGEFCLSAFGTFCPIYD